MSFEEALALLGLQAPADAQAVRAAYLRAIKVHSPERDPEGFKRVRAAYEQLRSPSRVQQPAPLEVPATERPDAAPELAAPTVHVDALQPYRERMWTVEDDDERVAVAREAVEQVGDVESYHLLLDALLRHETADEAALLDALRQAMARGHSRAFLPLLGRRFSDALTDTELEQWHQQGMAHDWPAVAIAYARRGRPAEATALALSRLASTESDEASRLARSSEILTLVLVLAECGEISRAADVLRAADAVYDLDDAKRREHALRTAMVRELLRVAPKLPRQVTAAIAGGLARNDPSYTDSALRIVNTLDARAAAKLLRSETQALYQCHGRALQTGDPDAGSSWLGLLGVFSMLVIMMSAVAFNMLDSSGQLIQKRSPAEHPSNESWQSMFCRPHTSPLCGPATRFYTGKGCVALATELRAIEDAAKALAARDELWQIQTEAISRMRDRTQRTCAMEADRSHDPP